jgi:ribosome-binding protein aMBF1 (putative translation factor)
MSAAVEVIRCNRQRHRIDSSEMMNKTKIKALKKAGFRVGNAEDFLKLTDEESRLVELRFLLSQTVRRLRATQHLTQKELAAKLKSSQSRIAKLEAAAGDVSLDLMFRGLFAVGGDLQDLSTTVKDR